MGKRKNKKYNMVQSMSRQDNCLDNAPAESFFHTLKEKKYIGKHTIPVRKLKVVF